ncbi:transposase [Streptomyces sp. SID8376]|nr:transposase [Streptomyces sp. McG7]MBT2903124.1 transposase [Streptomyces sp. McG8]MXQ61027.1 transposase [Streptomyces sp. XHT-2]MYW50380.1 transposase [Streptomyces sp. SID8376]UVT13502.1 transposase [Streptomyces thermocarboxydus]
MITDAMGDRIEPLPPADPVRGRRWVDHRRTPEAVAWKCRACSPWRDVPFRTAHKRLIRWVVQGTWERSLLRCRQRPTVLTASAGPCRWTPPSAGLTSTPPEPGRGGSRSGRTHRPCAWTPPQRPEHTDPPRLRQPCTTPGLRVTVDQSGDALAIETRHGRYPCSAKRTRKPRTRPDSVLPDRAFRPGPSGPVFLVGASALSILSRPTGSATVCGEAAVAAHRRSP